MSIVDRSRISLPNHQSTVEAGRYLARSLYGIPLTLLLQGELGSGKTTFFRGFAAGLGVTEHVTSPTFALEQRYATERRGELLHVDLYRLLPQQARELTATSDDHAGIRCIEWAERLEVDLAMEFPHAISIELTEEGTGRRMDATFRDLAIPSPAEITAWRKELCLPEHIIAHCHAVAGLCGTLAGTLLGRGILVRAGALAAAGELHDLLRFVDFHATAGGKDTYTPAQLSCWERWRALYAGLSHEEAAAAFLRDRGYADLAEIVAVHGARAPSPARATIEQKVLFYADKRVKEERVVSLRERERDLNARYNGGKPSPVTRKCFDEAATLEKELFPAGVPL